jgi:hypothetical protein
MERMTDYYDKAVQWYSTTSQWHGWHLVALCMVVVYVAAFIDLRFRSKRDGQMDRKLYHKRNGLLVDNTLYKALRQLKIEDKISDKEFVYWCRYFAWLGFDKFRNPKKHIFGPKAERMKEMIAKRLGKEEDTPVNLPG